MQVGSAPLKYGYNTKYRIFAADIMQQPGPGELMHLLKRMIAVPRVPLVFLQYLPRPAAECGRFLLPARFNDGFDLRKDFGVGTA